jgi:hypothetical protein
VESVYIVENKSDGDDENRQQKNWISHF